MRILVSMQHPADVHFFRNALELLDQQGHEIRVTVREKDILLDLLDHYDVDHTLLAGPAETFLELASVQARYELDVFREVRRFEPDVITAVSEPAVAHAGVLTDTPSVVFSDTEHATVQNALAYPFADRVVTPECYREDIGAKQVRYPGYQELAYLYPDRFTPDKRIREVVVDDPENPFVVLRLVSWNSAHDIGHSGFRDSSEVVSKLERAGVEVKISAEGPLPPSIESKRLNIPSDRIHDVLASADLFLGESATMAAESAILGTPAVYVSTIRLGYLDELESSYGLVSNHSGSNRQERGVETALELLSEETTLWTERRNELLTETVDTTDVIVDQLTSATAGAD